MSGLAALLGERVDGLVRAIPDEEVRHTTEEALARCAGALGAIAQLDLAPFELEDEGTADLSTWNALAPSVRNLLMVVRAAADRLATLFPGPVEADTGPDTQDLERAFDDVEAGGFGPERGPQIEDTLAESQTLVVVSSLTAMLQEDLVRFGQRVRDPRLAADRWALLGELHELKSNCRQCLHAVVAAVVRPWTAQPVEEWMPDFASATTRAVRLRTAIVDLYHEARELQDLLQSDPDQAELVFRRLDGALRVFATLPAYADLRPLDKQQLLQVRVWLLGRDWVDGRRQLEGFVRLLEVMRDINRREVLVKNDRAQLELATMLLESEEPVESVKSHLDAVYGRSDALDDVLRRWRHHPPPRDLVLDAMGRTREVLPP